MRSRGPRLACKMSLHAQHTTMARSACPGARASTSNRATTTAMHHTVRAQAALRTPEQPAQLVVLDRRALMGAVATLLALPTAAPARAAPVDPSPARFGPVTIRPELTPDQSLYDATDSDLRSAALLLQDGLNAADVEAEEAIWTQVIDTYGSMDKPWVADVVGRAYGNRGNARSRQGKLQEALEDFNKSIQICPWSVDPVLNRGVVLEALGRFDDAVTDYKAVLAAAPNDPAGWNNLGNALAGLSQWKEAVDCYSRASQLAPAFAFASANRALALYQLGERDESIREMRTLLRKYPNFVDMRAGLAAALWAEGREGDAESNWARVDDARYRDEEWLKSSRRWPPALRGSLQALLSLKSVNST